jgi:hypothetical protein
VTAFRRLPVALLLLSLAGCGGAAANADWVREPEGGGSLGSEEPLALEHDASMTSDSAPTGGPQRLAHTVTLGAVVAAPSDPAAPAAPAPSSITINLINYGGGQSPYYGYGYGYLPYYGSGRPGGGSPPSGFPPHPSQGGGPAPMQPGQSWPAAPSYGPAFPYHTGPASPWETKH